MESTTPPPSGVTPNIRGFRDLHLLGEGAMGDVYRAERIDAVPGSPAYVALKVLNKARIIQDLGGYSEADRERILRGVVARFRAEHEAGSNVCHPGILAYYKTDSLHSDEGHEFFAMEYAPGVTLDKHVAAKYPLDATDQRNLRSQLQARLKGIARLGHYAADALDALHQANVIHRDVKPDNILIVEDPRGLKQARVKVVDLGVAKIAPELLRRLPITQQRTANGIFGTPGFMAPEQWGGAESVTASADVFGLGRTLRAVLEGEDTPREGILSISDVYLRRRGLLESPAFRKLIERMNAFSSLINEMCGPEPSQRCSMRAVATRLQSLMYEITRTGTLVEDDPSSPSAPAFAKAVREWEDSGRRIFPSDPTLLNKFIHLSALVELTYSEETFLKAFEADVYSRRVNEIERARAEAELAKANAQAASASAREQMNAARRTATRLKVAVGATTVAMLLAIGGLAIAGVEVARLDEASRKIVDQTGIIDAQSTQLRDNQDAIAGLGGAKGDAENAFRKAEATLSSVESELAKIIADRGLSAEERVKKVADVVSRLKTEITNLNAQLAAQRKLLETANADNATLRQKLADAVTRASDLQQKLDVAIARAKELEGNVKELEGKLELADSRIKVLERKLQDAQNETGDVQQRWVACQRDATARGELWNQCRGQLASCLARPNATGTPPSPPAPSE